MGGASDSGVNPGRFGPRGPEFRSCAFRPDEIGLAHRAWLDRNLRTVPSGPNSTQEPDPALATVHSAGRADPAKPPVVRGKHLD